MDTITLIIGLIFFIFFVGLVLLISGATLVQAANDKPTDSGMVVFSIIVVIIVCIVLSGGFK